MPDDSSKTRSRRLGPILGLGAVVVVLAGLGVWWFVFRDDSAKAVDSAEAQAARDEAVEEALAEGDDDTATEEAATDDTATDDTATDGADSGDDAGSAGLDGTWTVDTSIGTFDESCLTDTCSAAFAGFRIDEELANIGAKTVVGRTPGVTGSLTIEGTQITATDIVVDMTGLLTDSGSRTNALRVQALETATFPEATFVLTEPIELGSIPADGTEIEVEATGDLTIRDVTRTETIPLTASVEGDLIVVFGQLGPILLDDYGIPAPTAAVVLSVEDNAIMELQLYFRRS